MRTKICKIIGAVISFAFISMATQAQDKVKEKDPVGLPVQVNDTSYISGKLVGSWILEEDPSTKITFTRDKKLKTFYNGVLERTEIYNVSPFCEGEKLSSGFFLTTTATNGSKNCLYIDNVDYNNTGILTLVSTVRGDIIIFKRE